jgi:hypothetical protein
MPSQSISHLSDQVTHQFTTFNYAKRTKTIPIPHGQKVVIGEVKGAGVITQLWLTFPGWFWMHWQQQAVISQTILKTLILRIFWDDSEKPAVEAPMGDFFGNGLCEVQNFASRYFGMSSGGFFSRFPMPFRKSFRIEVENLDKVVDTDLFLNAVYQIEDELDENEGYFHAQFNTGKDLQAGLELVRVEGSGHYAGCTLSLQGKKLNDLSFLEAPEYVYIDDDWEAPRITGTGLEDYFMGGWYFREGTLTGPFHGVPVKDALRSSVVMYRIHEADALRFQRRFRFTFVHPWEPERINPFFFSGVAYLYLSTPQGQGPKTWTPDELLQQYRMRDCDHQSIP